MKSKAEQKPHKSLKSRRVAGDAVFTHFLGLSGKFECPFVFLLEC